MLKGGAVIVGPKPSRSPSLVNYPECDDEIRKLADELWGTTGEDPSGGRVFGKGQVFSGCSAGEVLSGMGVAPDFECSASRSVEDVRYTHRIAGDTHIYFVASGYPEEQELRCSFRVTGKIPELWRADTGKMEVASNYSIENGRTTVNMKMDPSGSVFVIFRKPAGRSRSASPRTSESRSPPPKGPWDVAFPPGLGAPGSDIQQSDVMDAIAGFRDTILFGNRNVPARRSFFHQR